MLCCRPLSELPFFTIYIKERTRSGTARLFVAERRAEGALPRCWLRDGMGTGDGESVPDERACLATECLELESAAEQKKTLEIKVSIQPGKDKALRDLLLSFAK